MNNPVQLFKDLFDLYLKYINSGLPFSGDAYNKERNALMREEGSIYQPPIIELVPKYHEKATLSQFCIKENVSSEINSFVNAGLFTGNEKSARKLYDHQYESLKEAFINRKNVIVTTGTGSGKTECFLLPIISDLIEESRKWKTDRTRAMRCMILYPLNALAEDQMIRLRKALNSRTPDKTGALDWLDANRSGSRFYFGRYTGSTPVSGDKNKAAINLHKEKEALIKDWEAAKEAAYNNGNSELLYHVPCMDNDSAEMWNRFSMQDNAPDIMVTNYSMLNVILMRGLESPIFESTKKWLKEDKSHVFHLVIDELHSYRGTAGTEVAYLLRVLLDRLGLTPDSPQVQFLASSASMEETQQTMDYLSEFFGVDKKSFKSSFRIIGNPHLIPVEKPDTPLPANQMKEYAEVGNDLSKDTEFLDSVTCKTFQEVTDKYKLIEWLKYCLSSGNDIIPKDIVKMSERLDSEIPDKVAVVSALLKVLCKSEVEGTYAAPVRAHFFFRSVNGLWGCSSPSCTAVSEEFRFQNRRIGRFFKRPRTVCQCGNKILEVLVCENCGEVYLGGYYVQQENLSYITVEKPIAEKFTKYCVLWDSDIEEGPTTSWTRAEYNPLTGEVQIDPDGNYRLYIQSAEDETQFPSQCPQCGLSYRVKDKNDLTPIRRHSTGLQKVNQILADGMIRTMKRNHENNTKVVLFSDSRQAAAKLSAGIELDHYRDVLRWVILRALDSSNDNTDFLKRIRAKKKENLTREEAQKFLKLSKDSHYGPVALKIRNEWDGWALKEDMVWLDTYFANAGGVRLDNIENEVFSSLVKAGINPAGPKPSINYNTHSGCWYELFDFENGKALDNLGDAKQNFLDLIRQSNKNEQLASIFANKKKSFEDLKLGYLRPVAPCNNKEFEEVICSIIRILGSRRRIMGLPSRFPVTDSFPQQAKDFVKASYGISSRRDVDEKIGEIRSFLRNNRIIDSQCVALTGEGLSFEKANDKSCYWECPICKTIHMHASRNVCVNCNAKLGQAHTLSKEELVNTDDYYLALLNSTDQIYRLHCEELTGQTSKADSRKRQRLFQDIFLVTEKPEVEGIDLLSVTTTMEAGVDIGALSVVMMGNVPPQRFNYQQRVGRAGRRGNPLSVALTVARGTSHDTTHFFETARMVSDKPKDPYLEVRTKEIAERVIYKEVLYSALGTSGNNDNVHGSFGSTSEWVENKKKLSKWIKNNIAEIKHIIETVTRGTELTDLQKSEIMTNISKNLVGTITKITEDTSFTQEILSERLANAGLLPMFGFPTRTRNLYLSEPNKLPWDNVVSRDIDMALNSFAPGHEIVKDKKVYKAVGVVEYEYNRSHIVVPRINSINRYPNKLQRCHECGYSTISSDESLLVCPVCNARMKSIKICSPLGFCVDYNKPAEDFNGSYDWYSPNSDIKLDCEEYLTECPQVNNLTIRNNEIPSKGLVHLINDNNGDLYQLGKNAAGIYISRNAYSKEEADKLHLDYETSYAFVSSKSTGVLSLSVKDVNADICLDPINEHNINSNAVRAAFISWGYLVRKSISSFLDIDASELNVGYFISPTRHTAEVFLVEKLENGAGYCNYLSGRRYKDVPFKAIIQPLAEGGSLYEQLCNDRHVKECTSSCYDCIRDFSNQSLHSILDWRLGLDIARLAENPSAEVSFEIGYWRDYISTTIKNMLTLQGFKVAIEDGMLSGTDSRGIPCCIVHPLWSKSFIQHKLQTKPKDIRRISVFNISKLR